MTKVNFEIERLEGRGITAKVVNSERVYTTYRGFAKAAGYPEAAVQVWTDAETAKSVGADKIVGKSVKVLAKGKHEDHGGAIYVVESEDGERFLFGEDGLEIIEKGDCNMTKINLDGMSHVEMIGIIEEIAKRIKTESFSDGYDSGYENGKKAPKETPQQARDRIVEQAKADISELIQDEPHFEGKYYRLNYALSNIICEVDFVVNKGKRTVVAIMRGFISGKVYARGIAKCAPDDCFNVHIGKAIALRRALGLEVPAEYLNVPAPTEVRVGDKLRIMNTCGEFYEVVVKQFGGHKHYGDNAVLYEDGGFDFKETLDKAEIIDDSREEVSE